MSRSVFISIGLCTVGAVALFGWMFSSEPLQTAGPVQTSENIAKKPAAKKPGPVVFAVPRSKATALNDLPVNIVIDPVNKTAPVHPGVADLVVISSGLRMRAEPTSRSNSLGNYSRGAKFAHIRDENGWALVQSLDDGQKGWMFKKYMGEAG